MSDPVSLYLDQNLELSQFLILVILIGVSVYAVVVLICIFLMANNVKHLFVSLFAICGASLIAQLVKNPSTCNAGKSNSIPGSGRSAG